MDRVLSRSGGFWDERPVRVDNFGDQHLEGPLHVVARLGGLLNVVEQSQGVEEAPGMGSGDAPRLDEVGFCCAEENGDVLGIRVTNLDPLCQGVEGRDAGGIIGEEGPLRAEGVAGQHEPEALLPPEVPELLTSDSCS